MDWTDRDFLSDTLFLLAIVLIAFGAGIQWNSALSGGFWAKMVLYAAFIALGYKFLIYDRHRTETSSEAD